MKASVRKGFGFGLTSGIITTLGLIVGLHSSTHSRLVIIGGILVIAIADAMSDSLAMHISEESENDHTSREIWEATIATFLAKFVFASIFLAPVLLLALSTAIIVSVIIGLSLIAVFSYYIAVQDKVSPQKAITEHLVIAIVVILITHFLGDILSKVLI